MAFQKADEGNEQALNWKAEKNIAAKLNREGAPGLLRYVQKRDKLDPEAVKSACLGVARRELQAHVAKFPLAGVYEGYDASSDEVPQDGFEKNEQRALKSTDHWMTMLQSMTRMANAEQPWTRLRGLEGTMAFRPAMLENVAHAVMHAELREACRQDPTLLDEFQQEMQMEMAAKHARQNPAAEKGSWAEREAAKPPVERGR